MKTILLKLLAAQRTLLLLPPQSPLRRSTLIDLAQTVPAPILAHFLQLVEHGRVGVAPVCHGVCSGCHLRLPSSQLFALAQPEEIQICENCGTYLLPEPAPEAEAVSRPIRTVAPTRRRRHLEPAVPA